MFGYDMNLNSFENAEELAEQLSLQFQRDSRRYSTELSELTEE